MKKEPANLKDIEQIESDIKSGKNLSPKFSSTKDAIQYLEKNDHPVS